MTEDLLSRAIQSEIRARDFYADMAKRVRNPGGRRLLARLSRDEEGHRQALERRFRSLYSREFTPVEGLELDPRFEFKSSDIFEQTEALEAVSVAIGAEKNAIDFYSEQAEASTDGEERKLLRRLVKFEEGHRKKLQREYDRLNKRFYWAS